MRYDPIGAMNRAKGRRPATGGKLYRRLPRKTPTLSKDSWEWLYGTAQSQWDTAAGDALEDYRRIAFPERYQGWEVM